MKKIQQTLLLLVAAISIQAQVVTTNPTFVTEDKPVTITFDATRGTAGLQGNTEDWYAHIGVLTDKSTSAGDWRYVKTPWPNGSNAAQANTSANKLTKIGGDKATLTIDNIRAYFGVPAGEKIQKICLVFRNPTGSKEGKDDGGKDIFVDVYEAGLNVAFTSPVGSVQLVDSGDFIDFTIEASQSVLLNLWMDEMLFAITTGDSLSASFYFYTLTPPGSYWAIAEAGTEPNTVRDSMLIVVKKKQETAARPPLPDGINIVDDHTVTFILYAPNKEDVFVVGDFTGWLPDNDYMMIRDGDYRWLTVSNLQPGVEYAFQYLVDGNLFVGDAYAQKILDPSNDKSIPSATYPNLKSYPAGRRIGDGIVSVFQTDETPYNWEVTTYQTPRQDKLVIYELLIRDFTATSNLAGVMEKLDYLEGLGINAIELMPTQEFDGNDSWGYNPCYYFAMDKAYGTEEMYKKFIDECHKRGIAVILDVVYNHATARHPFAQLYWDAANNRPAADNPWFNQQASHPYSVFEDFNHESPWVRAFFKRNLKFLLEEYRFDGFRFDLSKGFTQQSSTEATASNYDASRIAILKDYYDQIKAVNPVAYMIIEHFAEDREERELADYGMMPWGNKSWAYGQAIMGFQSESEFTGVNGWTRSWTHNNLVGYMESHDEERMMYKAKTWGATTDIQNNLAIQLDRSALNAAFFLPLPGAKMIWQFGELGYNYSINSKAGSSEISDVNRTERKEIRWDYVEVPARKAVYDTYFKLNKLREQYGDAFDNPSYWDVQIASANWGGRRIALNAPDLKMVIVGNFNATGNAAINPNFPASGTWYDVMTEETMDVTNTTASITLAPGKFKILTNKKIDFTTGNSVIQEEKPALRQTADNLTILTDKPVITAKIYNISGLLMKQTQGKNTIPIAALPKGYYILTVQLRGEQVAFKFVK
ncbi:MAG: T9SS type A sorting domain-containing protein [Tannerella sp.]|jgi:1,4-alpha-glucan branching enzyme|nr:T9SS type A sorting domain-containing protein [Tannerella sp.]